MSPTDIREIERRAEAGDVDAQYAFAAVWAQRHHGDKARLWLERAAAQGHADALFTLAGALLSTTEGSSVHRAEVVRGFLDAQKKGSASATRMLAALTAAGLIGDGEDWPAALTMMREVCERRDPAALREVAVLLLGRDADDPDGAAMLNEAAASDALAAALVSRRRARGKAARVGVYSLDRAFAHLSDVRGSCDGDVVCTDPRIASFRGAVGVDLCDHLIGAAAPRMKREQVLGADGQRRVDPHRTAWGALLGFGFADLPAVFVGRRLAELADVPYAQAEPLSILSYRPGQEYRPHYDFLGPNDPDLAAHGQRIRTALLYLNGGYEGGETHFIAPKFHFKGAPGDALIFDNVDETGSANRKALHAGLPLISGEKWLASLWFRDRLFAG